MAIGKTFRQTPIDSIKHFNSTYDTYIFDGDGVLWGGDKAIAGAPDLINRLIELGKRVLILTNNATRGIDEWIIKCTKLGFTAVGKENIVSSAMVCAHELRKMKKMCEYSETSHLPIYLLGSNGLKRVLEDAGVESFGVGPDHAENYITDTFIFNLDLSRRPFAVVTSFDPHVNYVKIMKAVNYLKDSKIPFIVTNEDLSFPGPLPEIIVPGAGMTSTIIRAISGRTPKVMGKPHSYIWNYICDHFEGDIDPERTIMIGDRCDTDILFGNNNGLDTLLVLSGVTKIEHLGDIHKDGKDDHLAKYILPSVKDLLQAFK